jgi:hypothetical protein
MMSPQTFLLAVKDMNSDFVALVSVNNMRDKHVNNDEDVLVCRMTTGSEHTLCVGWSQAGQHGWCRMAHHWRQSR